MSTPKENTKRLTIDVNCESHKQLKILSADKGIPMRIIIERLIDGFIETMKDNDGK